MSGQLSKGSSPAHPRPLERDNLRLAFVIPWRDQGKWLWEHLPPGNSGDLIFAAPEPEQRNASRRAIPYLSEFLNLLARRPRWDDFDVIFTWELRTALATSLHRRLTRNRRSRWVVVGPIMKGQILKLLPAVRFLLRDADRIICFSRAECDAYAAMLKLPRDRFAFLPTPWLAAEEASDRDEGYILALGQSNRDFPTLLRAVEGTRLPIKIVAGNAATFAKWKIPPNVSVHFNTGHHRTIELIANATLHCIPLKDADYSAGQTVLLRAMARGKAVVVSDTPGIRDYVRDGETAVLVPVGDEIALKLALTTLWEKPSYRAEIGARAAQSVREEFGFERFTTALTDIAHDVIANN